MIFNQALPDELGFRNETMSKGKLEKLVLDTYMLLGNYRTAVMLDKLKRIGFEYATLGGITVGIDDLLVPPEKEKLIKEAQKDVEKIKRQYEAGIITNGERYNKVIDTWTRVTNEVAQAMHQHMQQDRHGFNPVFMMAESGARGNIDQVRQLAGMRGLMAKPQKKITGQIGEIIETPITANFREGLTVLEYFISTHGARKGLADTALKTADAGYLTRRLVDVAQDMVITEIDCGTILGLKTSALKEGEEVIESLKDRVLGRVALEDVMDPITGDLIVQAGDEIDEDASTRIDEAAIETVRIRSGLTCESRRGICAKCYGRNLANGKMVDIGEAVGVIAAQSIGEPGTQLTLRTFHIGGTAARIAEQSKVVAKTDGKITLEKVRYITKYDGEMVVISRDGHIILVDEENRPRARYHVPYASSLKVEDRAKVTKEQTLFEWDPYSTTIISEYSGKAEFMDLEEGETYREELDEITGLRQRVVIEQRERTLQPRIEIMDQKGKRLASYAVPTGSHLLVHPQDTIEAGNTLVKIPREISKTRDITGGLPRVAELFEARKPKEPAVVSEIDGVVEFGKIVRGARQLMVQADDGETKEYPIPHGKHLRVQPGTRVSAGDKLCEGPVDPHDILRIKGPDAVQEYLVNEIQEVYRLQGVKINDKHIEIIVRQMLQKVRVETVGDTTLLEGEQVDRFRFKEENERVIVEGGEAATFVPMLLGITRASLSTESFISAASFQETTKVLTEACINGKTDYLMGLKENVIIGRLIPAGTGLERYRGIEVAEEGEEKLRIEELFKETT